MKLIFEMHMWEYSSKFMNYDMDFENFHAMICKYLYIKINLNWNSIFGLIEFLVLAPLLMFPDHHIVKHHFQYDRKALQHFKMRTSIFYL